MFIARKRDSTDVETTEESEDPLGAVSDQRHYDVARFYAVLLQRRCQACRLELDRTAISELRAAPDDEVVHCEECGVILVRTKESGL